MRPWSLFTGRTCSLTQPHPVSKPREADVLDAQHCLGCTPAQRHVKTADSSGQSEDCLRKKKKRIVRNCQLCSGGWYATRPTAYVRRPRRGKLLLSTSSMTWSVNDTPECNNESTVMPPCAYPSPNPCLLFCCLQPMFVFRYFVHLREARVQLIFKKNQTWLEIDATA